MCLLPRPLTGEPVSTELHTNRIRVWGSSCILLVQRKVEPWQDPIDVAHEAVAAARSFWPGDPKTVTIEINGLLTTKVVEGFLLRDPMEFMPAVDWYENPALEGCVGQ